MKHSFLHLNNTAKMIDWLLHLPAGKSSSNLKEQLNTNR
jgi:hypothetical protein